MDRMILRCAFIAFASIYCAITETKKAGKSGFFQVPILKVLASSYVVVVVIALEYFLVFELHLHVNSPVFLVFEIYFQAVIDIAFIQAGGGVRIGKS
jgi:hypothetical protein